MEKKGVLFCFLLGLHYLCTNNNPKQTTMKKLFNITLVMLAFALTSMTAGAQALSPLEQLKVNPRKAYATDYPYQAEPTRLTAASDGY